MGRQGSKERPANRPPASKSVLTSQSPENTRQAGSSSGSDGDVKWLRRSITATLVEDAHPGSGMGGAGVDALVSRDRDGRPVIWASHIEGLLREAARAVHDDGMANRLFGARGGARQPAVFTSLYADTSPASRVWCSSARVSFDNRAPKHDTLHSVEFVPRGTCFNGQVELPSSDLVLINRLLREIDAVGRGRATGAGRVSFTLGEVPTTARTVGSATSRLLLLLRNLDPLCIAATAMPGNLIPTFPFVPGRTLVGALAGWLLSEGKREAASLLVDGRLSVSDALPVPDIDGAPTLSSVEVLPAPLALQSEKPVGTAGAVPWWARQAPTPSRINADGHTGSRLKRPEPDLFIHRVGDGAWSAYRPEIRVRLRNGRPDPDQADPSLFAIEQIAEQTRFIAEIHGESLLLDSLKDALLPVLDGQRWLRVGRAGRPVEVARVEWAEPAKPSQVRERAYLTLTSDLLMRDRRLRWLTALSPKDFADLPGWPPDLSVTPLFQDEASVNGFNGTSRLWRLPAAAIRRGSVFRVEGAGVEHLAQVAAAGQWRGERTHEGFGRFRVDEALPGVTGDGLTPTGNRLRAASSPDAPEDACACTTRGWLDQHRGLARAGSASERRPSLSQWQVLVADLAAGRADALSSRTNPTTAGAAGWRDQDAAAILRALEGVQDREPHARMFVRWLRAEMRRGAA